MRIRRPTSLTMLLVGSFLLRFGVANAQEEKNPSPETKKPKPDLYLLSVGIDRYPAPTSELRGCVNDAKEMAKRFEPQKGDLYGSVEVSLLTDSAATREGIEKGFDQLRAKGKPGDWYVVLLSGHAGFSQQRWGFTAYDRENVSDLVLLEFADELASAGKIVFLVIDACHAGQLRYVANPILNRHRDSRKGGGIILGVSSMPSQLSSALQAYSAFAQAVADGLAGLADTDDDRLITLKELRRYAYNRVYELSLAKRPFPGVSVDDQDSSIEASISISENIPLVRAPERKSPADQRAEVTKTRPELVGNWSVQGSGAKGTPYKLILASNGRFRALFSEGQKLVRTGTGTYKTTENGILLSHRQGMDRLEIKSFKDHELVVRFNERDIPLHRDALPSNSVADSTWTGSESLEGFGKLAFQLDADGRAVMHDVKSAVIGEWNQYGNEVVITFQNCVYAGTLSGDTVTGRGRYTQGVGTWTFQIRRDPVKK